jgi:hypothetical protein
MMSDYALAKQAPVIAEVSVLSVSPAPAEGTPSTDYIVLVERLLKGSVSGTSIVVRVAGGIAPDQSGLRVYGVPAFREGERAILFLAPRGDGTYGILHLMLGAFQEVLQGERRLAVRDLSEMVQLGTAAGAHEVDLPRNWEAFLAWLGDVGRGIRRDADYYIESSEVRGAFEYSKDRRYPVAWREFHQGRKVSWRWDSEGWDGKGSGRREILEAMAAWNEAAPIDYQLKGTTASTAGFERHDGINAILFNDPREWSPGAFDCLEGGTLSFAGLWFDPAVTFRYGSGKDAIAVRILEADLITNDGGECFLGAPDHPPPAAEVLAHELGHTLGLAHSEDPGSLMFAAIQDDGRGAALSPADQRAVAALYPSRKLPLERPTGLAARIRSASQMVLTWNDNSAEELGHEVQITSPDGRLSAFVEADRTRLGIAGLSPDTEYVIRVRAIGENGHSRFSRRLRITTPPA